jgi:FdhD protein
MSNKSPYQINKIAHFTIRRYAQGVSDDVADQLAVEEPMELQISYGPLQNRKTLTVAITMRTPGDDEQLALGFLINEGILQSDSGIMRVNKNTHHENHLNPNIIHFIMAPDVHVDDKAIDRNFYMTSSCGVCGKASADSIRLLCPVKLIVQSHSVSYSVIIGLSDKMRQVQNTFDSTGGLHASALFDQQGKLLALKEDVGRHNATDKITGYMAQNGILHKDGLYILMLSGRASFELIQKSAMSGISVVCSVGAPSSLAVATARKMGITLIGFLRGDRFNVYSHAERVFV